MPLYLWPANGCAKMPDESDFLNQAVITQLVELARCAGDVIMDVYNRAGAIAVERKIDQSPLTLADTAAHRVIAQGLPEILDVPMISEEAPLPAFSVRVNWQRYWLIDPLDGTKEFVLRSGEFTVNIALIDRGVPVLGLVHLPTQNMTYVGVHKKLSTTFSGAWKYSANEEPLSIRVRSLNDKEELIVLASHRHGTAAVTSLLQTINTKWHGSIRVSNAGSSLKFCHIAEGKADFYPRLAPTSEWDTAAAQAVLSAAGGAVVKATGHQGQDFEVLKYNQQADILNPNFYAFGDIHFPWKKLLS